MTEAGEQGQEAANIEASEDECAGVWRGEILPLFAGGTEFLSGLVTGAIEVLRRVIGAGIQRAGGLDPPHLLMIIFLGGGAVNGILRSYTTIAITVALGAWGMGALWFSPAPANDDEPGDEEPEQEIDAEGDPVDQPADPSAVPAEEFIQLLHDASNSGTDNVHLSTLAERLAADYPGEWDVSAVHAVCAAAGVPVRPTVRAPGRRPTVGVHRDDIPPLPREESDPAL